MKKNEFKKIALGSTLAVVLWSGLFIGAQHTFMRASQGHEIIAHQLNSIHFPAGEVTFPEGFEMPVIDIYNRDGFIEGLNLTGEEAVEFGLMYLIDFFGESFDTDDITVEVLYEVSGSWWEMYVIKDTQQLYRLDIDANTGSLLLFDNYSYEMRLTEKHGRISRPGPFHKNDTIPNERIDEFYDLARTFASAYFNSTDIVNIEFSGGGLFLWNLNDEIIDEHLFFHAFDAIGRHVQLQISRELKTLIRLQSIETAFFPEEGSPQYQEGSFGHSGSQISIGEGSTIKEAILDFQSTWPHILTRNNTVEDIQIYWQKELEGGSFVVFQEAENTISHAFVIENEGSYQLLAYGIQEDLEDFSSPSRFDWPIMMMFGNSLDAEIHVPTVAMGVIDNQNISRVVIEDYANQMIDATIFQMGNKTVWFETVSPTNPTIHSVSGFSEGDQLLYLFEASEDGFRTVIYDENGESIIEYIIKNEYHDNGETWSFQYRNGELISEM